jgi:peptidoglycan/xylan/chitin deacetylase (PgdA/CDA1 family)
MPTTLAVRTGRDIQQLVLRALDALGGMAHRRATTFRVSKPAVDGSVPGRIALARLLAVLRATFACAVFATLLMAAPAWAAGGVAILAPADGAQAGGRVVITAAAPAETTSVEFSWSVDGVVWSRIATDGERADGWQAVWESRPHDGAVKLRALASVGASATISVTVDNTAPVVSAEAAPSYFSPNGDGSKDATVLAVAVSETTVVDISVLDSAGNLVGVLAADQVVERAFRVPWNGLSADGGRAPDGAYRLVVDAHDRAGNAVSTAARVLLDTAPPRLRWASNSGIVGSARLKMPFRIRDASAPLSGRFRLVSSYERVVRSWQHRRLSVGAGSSTLPRKGVLATVPGGYRVRAVITDAAGNRSSARLSAAYRFAHRVRTRVVARAENAGRYVALTFDDCAFPLSWDSILDTLARARVKGAFFCPGIQVQASPRLAARTVRAGHTVGSHGWDHALLTASGYGDVLSRLTRDRNVWWNWGEAATPYFRPPYGAFNASVLAAAGAAGYRHTVLWDVDTRDWTNPGVGAIVSRAVGPARSGSIILLHVKPQTASALPHIIRGLRARGLKPIGLDQLLHRPGASGSPAGWTARLARRTVDKRG